MEAKRLIAKVREERTHLVLQLFGESDHADAFHLAFCLL